MKVVSLFGALICVSLAASAGDLGDKRVLLWDMHDCDAAATTCTFVQHAPVYADDSLVCDEPWEGDGCGYFNILEDEDAKGKLYRMYYLGRQIFTAPWLGDTRLSVGPSVCYAESRDGIRWTKPDLGLAKFWTNRMAATNEHNNIILSALDIKRQEGSRFDNFMVFKDTRPGVAPAELYKGVSLDYDKLPGGGVRAAGLSYWTSPDGLRFKHGPRFKVPGIAGDSLNCVWWDATRGLYQFYARANTGRLDDRFGDYCVRFIRHATSKDFENWTPAEFIKFEPGQELYSLYTSMAQPYFRRPDVIIGFPSRYVERRSPSDNYNQLVTGSRARRDYDYDVNPRYGLVTTDTTFMYSYDGANFKRLDEAWFRPGPETPDNWRYGDTYPARGLVQTKSRFGGDDELSYYASFGEWSGKGRVLKRYTIRMDGFLSAHAGYEEKRLVTKPFAYSGDELRLNFSTSARGYVLITMRDEAGNELHTDELYGDRTDRLVRFRDGHVSAFAGRTVTLTFDFRDADLYSFRFAPAADLYAAGGKTDRVIVANDDTRFAAEELKVHLEKATGATFPIVAKKPAGARAFVLVRRPGKKTEEHAAVKTDAAGDVVFTGTGPRGTEYAVYAFLERELGVRWFAATAPAFVPAAPRWPAYPVEFTEKPRFVYRSILTESGRLAHFPAKDVENAWLAAYRNRINVFEDNLRRLPDSLKGKLVTAYDVREPMQHALFHYLPPAKYFKDHPDWYTMNAAGKRVDNLHVCFSNPDACAELTKNILARVKADGGTGIYSFTPEDLPEPLCLCDGCRALMKKHGCAGAPYFAYAVELAKRLQKDYPDVMIKVGAYRPDQTQQPPKGLRFPDNVFVSWAPLFDDFSKGNYYNHCRTNEITRTELQTWCSIARVCNRDYTTIYGANFTPYSCILRWSEPFRVLEDFTGLVGGDFEHGTGCYEGINTCDLVSWLLTRFYRDPHASWKDLVVEFCQGYYGKAWREAVEYVMELERLTAEYPVMLCWQESIEPALTPERLVRWDAIFARAIEKVEKRGGGGERDVYIQRLNELRGGLDLALLRKYRAIRAAHPDFAPTAESIRDRAKRTMERATARRGAGSSTWARYLDTAWLLATREPKPLPEAIANLPEKDVLVIYPVVCRKGLVEDPDAALGIAVNSSAKTTKQKVGESPAVFGVLDKVKMKFTGVGAGRATIPPETIVPDAYHLYPCGRVTIPNVQCEIWNNAHWYLNIPLAEAWVPGEVAVYDLYVSCKFEGLVYSPKSRLKEGASVSVDRVVLVKVDPGK